MSLLDWFENRKKTVPQPPTAQQQREFPEGLWTKCRGCGTIHYTKEWEQNLQVCSSCGYHAQVSARERILHLIDPDTWEPLNEIGRAHV